MKRNVLITGASQGIGAYIAETFAKKGYNVSINCRSEKEIENGGRATAEKCRMHGVEAECFAADVSDFNQCAELVKKVAERFGSVDVLVNNAGITRDGLLALMKEDQFDSVIAVNLKGAFNMMHHVAKLMIKAKYGRIVNISSVSGLYGNPGQANYSASKAGIVGLTLSAAKELGPRGITVNAVAPGFIDTPMTRAMPQKAREAALASIALKRAGTPQDVANAVAFLASDEASYISGQVLVVDGCMTI